MATQYFLLKIGETASQGPLTESEARKELLHIHLDAWYIWREGMANWEVASQSQEVLKILKVQQAPPPAPIPAPKPAVAETKPEVIESEFVRTETLGFDNSFAPPALEKESAPVEAAKASEKIEIKSEAAQISTTVGGSATGTVEEVKKASGSEVKKATGSYTVEELNRRKNMRVPLRLSAIVRNSQRAFITSTRNVSLGGMLLTHSIPDYILNTECEVFLVDRQKNIGVSFKCIPIPDDGVRNRFQFEIKEHKHLETLAKWLDEQVLSMKQSA